VSLITIGLYLLAFGLWGYAIFRDGGIGIGIRFSYGLHLTLFFLLGPVLSVVVRGHDSRPGQAPVEPAIQLVLCGMLAYVIAAYWVYPVLIGQSPMPHPRFLALLTDPGWCEARQIAGWRMFWVGVASLVLNPVVFSLPTIKALWTVMGGLAETGLLLVCLASIGRERYSQIVGAFVLLAMYSMLYAALGGHIGSQFLKTGLLACIVLFCNSTRPTRVVVLVVCIVLAFFPYQQWMAGRKRLRSAIGESVSLSKRIEITVDIFLNVEPIQVEGEEVANAYAKRGDYSPLLATAMQYTPDRQPFAYGTTLLEGFTAIIPRALWPDKPYRVGGNALVSQYTGLHFDTATSVAVTYPFEFYVNFGREGVIVGLFVLGLLFGWMEHSYYVWAVRDPWGELSMVFMTWILAVDAGTIALAMMMIPAALVITWGAARWVPRGRRFEPFRNAASSKVRSAPLIPSGPAGSAGSPP
jgi:hypothetical protein